MSKQDNRIAVKKESRRKLWGEKPITKKLQMSYKNIREKQQTIEIDEGVWKERPVDQPSLSEPTSL